MSYFKNNERKIILDRDRLAPELDRLRGEKRIVFTNGCFDLLHPGHVNYLARARDEGDLLVVALNADGSVRRLKGPSRPLNPLAARATVMAGLGCVDYVTSFEEDTPIETLRVLRPHIHCKGGDYRLEDLPEAAIVREIGGQVVLLPHVAGHSTTGLVERLIPKK